MDAELIRFLSAFLALPLADLPQTPSDMSDNKMSERAREQTHACMRRDCESWAHIALVLRAEHLGERWVDLCAPCHRDLHQWVADEFSGPVL